MAKPLNDSALIKTIASSKTPMTAEQIAGAMNVMRHKLAPMLRELVKSSQIIEFPAAGDIPLRFSCRQAGDGNQDQSVGKVVQIASGTRRKDEDSPAKQAVVAKSAEKPAQKPAAKKPGRPPLKSVGESSKLASTAITDKKSASSTNQEPAAKPSVAAAAEKTASAKELSAKAHSASTILSNDEPMYNRVLRMLGEEPTKREEILMELGPIGLLIDEMSEKGVIESTYLIDSHVFELTDAGQLELEALPEPKVAPVEPVILATPVAAALTPASMQVETPAKQSEVNARVETAPASRVTEDQAALPLTEPVVPAPTPTPSSPAPVAVLDKAQAAKEQDLPENPIMAEMTKLMEKLVTERMGALTQKIEQGDKAVATLAQVGASIKKATSALQIALDALNEIGDTIS